MIIVRITPFMILPSIFASIYQITISITIELESISNIELQLTVLATVLYFILLHIFISNIRATQFIRVGEQTSNFKLFNYLSLPELLNSQSSKHIHGFISREYGHQVQI